MSGDGSPAVRADSPDSSSDLDIETVVPPEAMRPEYAKQHMRHPVKPPRKNPPRGRSFEPVESRSPAGRSRSQTPKSAAANSDSEVEQVRSTLYLRGFCLTGLQ